MPFSQSDAITQEVVRNRVEEIVQEDLQFRQAFRQTQVPDGTGETWKVVQPDDTIGDPDTIAPGSSYPGTEEDYSKIEIDREKYGLKMAFLDEGVMDNVTFDVIADQVDRAGRQMAEKLNTEAFSELDANLATESPVGDDTGTLAYSELLDGKKELRADSYDPDIVILDPEAERDLQTDSSFNRATDQSDDLVRDGQIARVSGMDVVVSDAGEMASHDAYLIDTDQYGYEAVWSGVESESWRDEDSDTEYRKIRTFRGFKAIDSEAAIQVQG